MTQIDATDLLRAERYLRFHDLRAGPAYDGLTVWVDGAEKSQRLVSAHTGDDDIDRILGPLHAIEAVPGCLRYRVVFADCVTYAVRNESFALPEPGASHDTMLRRYDRSVFLDYLGNSTFAADAVPQPISHIELATLDMIIDVATTAEPQITAQVIRPDDPGPLPGRPREHG